MRPRAIVLCLFSSIALAGCGTMQTPPSPVTITDRAQQLRPTPACAADPYAAGCAHDPGDIELTSP